MGTLIGHLTGVALHFGTAHRIDLGGMANAYGLCIYETPSDRSNSALSSDYRLRGYRRRIARKLVEASVPNWDGLNPHLADDVLDATENTIRNYPPFVRFGIGLMLIFIEFGGPLTLTGIVPLSFLSRDEAVKRLEKWSNHRWASVHNIPKFLKIVICLNAYSRKDIEAHIGADRRVWRPERVRFRERLVQLDESRALPPTPEPLGSEGLSTAADYLVLDVGPDGGIRPSATVQE